MFTFFRRIFIHASNQGISDPCLDRPGRLNYLRENRLKGCPESAGNTGPHLLVARTYLLGASSRPQLSAKRECDCNSITRREQRPFRRRSQRKVFPLRSSAKSSAPFAVKKPLHQAQGKFDELCEPGVVPRRELSVGVVSWIVLPDRKNLAKNKMRIN